MADIYTADGDAEEKARGSTLTGALSTIAETNAGKGDRIFNSNNPAPVTTNAYNGSGQVLAQTDPLGNTTTFAYLRHEVAQSE